jgi:hypothetical protein
MVQEKQEKGQSSQALESGGNPVSGTVESAAKRRSQATPSKSKLETQSTVSATLPQLTQPAVAKSKNRPQWRIPLGQGPKNARFPGYQSRYGDGHPSRRQCIATARHGGQCRLDALRGAACCGKHGGHAQAARMAGVTVTLATMRKPRVALASVGAMPAPDGFPLDVALPVSPVDRGRLYEAWQNRALAPSTWQLELTATRNSKPR